MTYRTFILFGMTLFLFVACAPRVKTKMYGSDYSVLPFSEKLVLISRVDSLPASAELLGDVKVKDGGLTVDCEYERMLQEIKFSARKAGANLVRVTKVISPNAQSTCYRIWAEIYRVSEEDKNEIQEGIIQRESVNQDSVRIIAYRPGNYGTLVNYKLRLNDSELFKMTANSVRMANLPSSQSALFWAKTESKDEIETELESGKTYYIRCGLNMGVFVGTPDISIVKGEQGRIEIDLMPR